MNGKLIVLEQKEFKRMSPSFKILLNNKKKQEIFDS